MPDQAAVSDTKDKAYYARIAADYFRRQSQPIQRFATRTERTWLLETIRRGSDVLLVGVGGGREIDPLLELGCSITALDYSPEMVDVGRHHWADHDIRWMVGDAHDLHEHHGGFDAVICLAAVNYFVEPMRAMTEMGRCLRTGGSLVVSTINRRHPTERDTKVAAGHHRTLFDADDMRRMACDAGLEPIFVRGMRVFVDRLPPAWNRDPAPRLGRATLDLMLAIEPLLGRLAGPNRCKFCWLAARKP
jgi:SAM-dependent methyltransferase